MIKETEYEIPIFTKELRDDILNYTDDKSHKSFLKVLDNSTFYKLFMGAKNVSKSFGCMIEAIYKILNDSNYNCVFGRNLSKDIVRTVRPTFLQAISFLETKHNIKLSKLFDVYMNQIIFKPTGQGIYFGNFELANSFAGITLPKSGFYFGDLFLDEIQQNPLELGDSKNFSYEKQEADLEFIIQSTVLRVPGNQQRRVIFTFNVYDSDHWVCERFVKPTLPFSSQNRDIIINQGYLFADNYDLNCSMIRMSRFYVPKETISIDQLKYYDELKISNPKLYDITVAGEAYDIENPKYSFPFKKYIFENNEVNNNLILNNLDFKNLQLIVDGYDPGLRDKNGLVRIGLSNDFKLLVIYCEEIDSKNFSNFKRFTTSQFVLEKINHLNKIMNVENSLLAIDSKEDTVIEIMLKYISENNLNITPIPAIKNKNPSFKIDFSIINRIRFFKECFEKEIILFTPQAAEKLLIYFSKIAVDDLGTRNEKINAEIYDAINALEYACSIVYSIVIANNISE